MSQQLISRSEDLKRLQDEGYAIDIRAGYLLTKNVPYVNAEKEVKLGTLVSELTLAGDITAPPSTHVAFFVGDHPCNQDGSKLTKIEHGSAHQQFHQNLAVDHSFSAKPLSGRYKDYFEKVTTYVAIISAPARVIAPNVTARAFSVIPSEESESVFNYIDTASSRAGINVVSETLERGKVGIIGLGGTGSYVIDLVAKTAVKEIHLFDGDDFLQHNAFRSPGAPSIDQLVAKPKKVDYFRDVYSKMRRGIFAHDYDIDHTNVDQLCGLDFIFLCLDRGEPKRLIVENLEVFGTTFVDVGMGVDLVDGSLRGVLRVTSSIPEQREHFKRRVSLADARANDDYDHNIQIADLNALNAALAVIKWKKLWGFYSDLENENYSTYTIDGNMLLNADPS